MWNTSILLPSAVMAPVTLLFGPILSFNIVQGLAPVVSAFAAMLAVSRFGTSRWAAWLGGLVYGFSPFVVVKLDGHPNLAIAVFPPIALICMHELFVRRRHSPVMVGSAFGAAAAAQLVTGEEILMISAIAFGIGLLITATICHRSVARYWRHGITGLGTAAVVALALASPFLWYQFRGPQRVECCLPHLDRYVLDLQTLVVPSSYQLLHTGDNIEAAARWRGFNESNGYLGVPLVAALGISVAVLRKRTEVVIAAILMIVMTIFALGRRLEYGGHVTAVRLPWALLRKLPLLGDMVTARFMLISFLCVAVIIGISADEIWKLDGRRRRVGLTAAGLLALTPLLPVTVSTTHAEIPTFFTSGAARKLLPADSVVLMTPFFPPEVMLWQATADMRFKLVQGSVILPGPTVNGPITQLTQRLHLLSVGQGPADPRNISIEERSEFISELERLRVTTIIVGPSPGRADVEAFTEALLHQAPRRSGGVSMFSR